MVTPLTTSGLHYGHLSAWTPTGNGRLTPLTKSGLHYGSEKDRAKACSARVALLTKGGPHYDQPHLGTVPGCVDLTPGWDRRMTAQLRHPPFGYTVSYRRAIELQARILAAWLTGELSSYQPLVTR
jgi:hypothetical protein